MRTYTEFRKLLPTTRLALLAAIASFAGLVGGLHWRIDLAAHHQLAYLAWFATALLVALAMCRRRDALLVALLALPCATQIAVAQWRTAQTAGEGAALKVLTFNISNDNERTDELVAWIRRENPDIILLQEFTPRFEAALTSLRGDWPYGHGVSRPDPWGIALFSRHPVTRLEVHFPERVPVLVATVELDGSQVAVVSAHPLPPIDEEMAGMRDEMLAELGQRLAQRPGPIILGGDLNATPWSTGYRALAHRAGLVPLRSGLVPQPTWPAWFAPVIPIDHVLVRGFTGNARIGPHLGSDHLPVIGELRLSGAARPATAVAHP